MGASLGSDAWPHEGEEEPKPAAEEEDEEEEEEEGSQCGGGSPQSVPAASSGWARSGTAPQVSATVSTFLTPAQTALFAGTDGGGDRRLPREPVTRAAAQQSWADAASRLRADAQEFDAGARPLWERAAQLNAAAEAAERSLSRAADRAESPEEAEEEGEPEAASGPSEAPSAPKDVTTPVALSSAPVSPELAPRGDSPEQPSEPAASEPAVRRGSSQDSGGSWARAFPVLGDDEDDNVQHIQDWLERQIERHSNVVVGRTGCPFSSEAKKILMLEGVQHLNLLVDKLPKSGFALQQLFQEGSPLTGNPRYGLPVVWINGTLCGSLTELRQMAKKGLLEVAKRKQQAELAVQQTEQMWAAPDVEERSEVTSEGTPEVDDRPKSGPPGPGLRGRYRTAGPPPPPTGEAVLAPGLRALPPREPLLLRVSSAPPPLALDSSNLYEALGPRKLWQLCAALGRALWQEHQLAPFYRTRLSGPREIAVRYGAYLCERLGGPGGACPRRGTSGRRYRVGGGPSNGASVLCCPLQLGLRHRHLRITPAVRALWLAAAGRAMEAAGVAAELRAPLAELFAHATWVVAHGWLHVDPACCAPPRTPAASAAGRESDTNT
eukprot:TRINITY_DN6772_c0_g4_i1.p1 TRINITY_DN6772_c0_g4~~TRINITY_DN6772_c0_g4_i1.p1  ORF type:complete len:608 (+),score=204.29 TRINITY_DN6772_c0_g4_i1:89-1912(+)